MAFRVAVIRSAVFRISMNLPLRSFPADVREPEEVERFWFCLFPDGTVFDSEAAELHQTGFLQVNRESELPQSALHGYTEAPGIVSFCRTR